MFPLLNLNTEVAFETKLTRYEEFRIYRREKVKKKASMMPKKWANDAREEAIQVALGPSLLIRRQKSSQRFPEHNTQSRYKMVKYTE